MHNFPGSCKIVNYSHAIIISMTCQLLVYHYKVAQHTKLYNSPAAHGNAKAHLEGRILHGLRQGNR
jgi:hypothetical protein